jgi:glycosyltransferase involved in cell wall biosynthesis
LPVPFTLTLHDLRRLARFPQRLVAGPILAASIRRAAGVVTVSETVREQVRQRFQPRRTWVVPNAGDHLQAAPRAAPPEAFLLHVGHLEPRKNIALLLHALARDTTLPGLTLAGAAKDKEQERLAAMSRRLGIHERVRFLGPFADADLPELYARCAAAVFPSRIEGFGIGVIEALRAKAPVAIAAAGALPEIAGPGVPQFAPDDPLDCARAIHEALELDAGQRDELARNAARFAWQKSAERLVEVWREVAAPL